MNKNGTKGIITKLLKISDKERKVLKAAKEKQNKGKGNSGFLIRSSINQKIMGQYLQNTKRQNCHPRILNPAKLSLKNEGKIMTLKHTKAERIH